MKHALDFFEAVGAYADCGWVTLVLFRRRALGELSAAEQRIGGARSKKPSEGSRWHGGRGPYAN